MRSGGKGSRNGSCRRMTLPIAILYEGQLAEGDKYQALHKAVTVNILSFNEIDNERYHNVFHVREDTDGSLLTDRLAIHFLELPKLRDQAVGVERRLVRWLTFLTVRSKERMAELVKGDAVMEKAMTTLEFLSQDQKTRMLYEARQKALHDYASAIGNAEERGKREGEHAKAISVARAMLAKGMDTALVAEVTGLPPEDIRKLLTH